MLALRCSTIFPVLRQGGRRYLGVFRYFWFNPNPTFPLGYWVSLKWIPFWPQTMNLFYSWKNVLFLIKLANNGTKQVDVPKKGPNNLTYRPYHQSNSNFGCSDTGLGLDWPPDRKLGNTQNDPIFPSGARIGRGFWLCFSPKCPKSGQNLIFGQFLGQIFSCGP